MENQYPPDDRPYVKQTLLLKCTEQLREVREVYALASHADLSEYGVIEATWENFLETIHPDDRVILLEEKLLQETTGWISDALTLRVQRTQGDYVSRQIHAQFGSLLLHCVWRAGSAGQAVEDRIAAEGCQDACS